MILTSRHDVIGIMVRGIHPQMAATFSYGQVSEVLSFSQFL